MPTERKCSVCDFCSVEHNDYCKCEAMYLVRNDRQKKAYIMDDICIADMCLHIVPKYSRAIFKEIDTSKTWPDLRRDIILRMYRNGNPSIKIYLLRWLLKPGGIKRYLIFMGTLKQ